jgi:hypothetical protein
VIGFRDFDRLFCVFRDPAESYTEYVIKPVAARYSG